MSAQAGLPSRGAAGTPGHRNATILDFRRLRAFVAVAEELHFRRAADRLVMTQSPLSRIIKGLEHDLGLALFTRNKRRVQLTTAGASLLADARLLLNLAEESLVRARIVGTAATERAEGDRG